MSVVSLCETTLGSNPAKFKELLFRYGKVVVVVDKIENDLTRSCQLGERILAEPSRPPISATRRYIIWYKNKLIYCKIMRTRKNAIWNILGIGEVNADDIKFWCNAKKL